MLRCSRCAMQQFIAAPALVLLNHFYFGGLRFDFDFSRPTEQGRWTAKQKSARRFIRQSEMRESQSDLISVSFSRRTSSLQKATPKNTLSVCRTRSRDVCFGCARNQQKTNFLVRLNEAARDEKASPIQIETRLETNKRGEKLTK